MNERSVLESMEISIAKKPKQQQQQQQQQTN